MKNQFWCSVKAISLLIFTLIPWSVSYAANSGEVTFVGYIVAEPCQVSSDQAEVTQTCHQGHQAVTSRIKINSANGSSAATSVNDVSTLHFYWIDKTKKLGITEVMYY